MEDAPLRGAGDPLRWGELLPMVPGAEQLLSEGFVPLEDHGEWAAAWPREHRRVLHDTRYELTGLRPFDKRWGYRLFFVRSPWPTVDVRQVERLLWKWVRRNDRELMEGQTRDGDKKAELKIIRQLFRQSETWVAAYAKGRVNRSR